jgi:hypothetical protein
MPRRCVQLSVRLKGTEQTVFFVIWAGGEIHRVGAEIIATCGATADTKAPQPVDGKDISLMIAHEIDQLAIRRIVGTDTTVSEISDQQGTAEWPEIVRRRCDAPRRIEAAELSEADASHR